MFFMARATAPTFAAPRGRTNTTRMLLKGIGRDRSIPDCNVKRIRAVGLRREVPLGMTQIDVHCVVRRRSLGSVHNQPR